MSEDSEQHKEQTAEDLAATLAAYLNQTVTGDLRRNLEPAPAFSAEASWASTRTEPTA